MTIAAEGGTRVSARPHGLRHHVLVVDTLERSAPAKRNISAEKPLGAGEGRWLLVAVGTGSFMSGLDSSISNTVLPVIANSLRADVATVEWVVAVYLLVLSGLVLIFGRLGDMWGHRRVYLAGFGLFVFGSLVSALARSEEHTS